MLCSILSVCPCSVALRLRQRCAFAFSSALSRLLGLRSHNSTSMSELIDEPWILDPPDNVIGSFVAGAFRTHGLDAHLLATQRFVTIMQESVLRYNAERWSLKALPIDLGLPRVPLASFCLAHRTLSPVVELFNVLRPA